MKRLFSVVLAICIMMSCVLTTDFILLNAGAVKTDVAEISAGTGPQDNVQGSVILHCFNWSYNSIKSNLSAIKAAGYTAVQTSPVQSPKDFNSSWSDQSGQWWKLYQPLDFNISNHTWLGTKSELKSLCDEAEKMGIKVIVDVVANHVANNQEGGGYGNINGGVASNLRRNDFYHDNYNWANDNSRYEMTMGHIGMPDLNTAHPDVQNIVKNFLNECISIGVDGFRFDAAKHIELPNDQGNSSNFWPTVINGSQASTSKEIYYYGEILNGCGTDINNYTKYMSITDNNTGDAILVAANNNNASSLANSSYFKGASADKSVLWVESHDTNMGHSGSAGLSQTSGVSDSTIIKAWGMVGSRADSTALFFARPAHNMGQASTNTTWKSTPVAEVNKFKNYFDGQSEHLSSEGSIAYNERGTSGVVLVNANGGSASVNVRANKIADGTYKDTVSGGTFTVSGGRITGNIGSSGVAVVYNPSSTPVVTPTQTPTQAPTVAPTQPQYTKYRLGDVNLDGEINIIDASKIQSHLAMINPITGTSLKTADVNKDSNVDIADAALIQRFLANMSASGSHCGEYINVEVENVVPVPDVKGDYVYYKNTSNWSNVMIYYWSDSNSNMISWPGVSMKHLSDDIYYCEVPDDIDYVIFTNGSGDQTQNINFTGINMIYNNGNWSAYGNVVKPTSSPVTPTQAPTTPPTQSPNIPQGNYIYYKNNENWGEVKVYYWNDNNSGMTSWPGQHMEPIGNNVYRAEIPSEATMVVFNNNNQGKQSSDIRLEGMNKIYDNGSWSTYYG